MTAVKIKMSKTQELETLSKRRDRNKSLPIKQIAGKSYSNLDKTKFWEFIESNFSKVKVIHKDSIGNLFEADGIKSINCISELFQYKVSSNYQFIIDLCPAIKELDVQVAICRETISEQESIILSITDAVRKKLEVHITSEIQDLEYEINTSEKIQSGLVVELKQKETERASNYTALSTIEENQI